MDKADTDGLAVVLAGPLLRRVQARKVALWMATSCAVRLRVALQLQDGRVLPSRLSQRTLQAGTRLHLQLIELTLDDGLPEGVWIGYRIQWAPVEAPVPDPAPDLASDQAPDQTPDTSPHPTPTPISTWNDATEHALCYPGRSTPGFVHQPRVRALLHGSCRKPHHDGGDGSGDGLVRADAHLGQCVAAPDAQPWPSVLVLSGDQVYCDDVAGPMLRAIHGLVARLGLPDEALPGTEAAGLASAEDLYRDPSSYYRRMSILPRAPASAALIDLVFGGGAQADLHHRSRDEPPRHPGRGAGHVPAGAVAGALEGPGPLATGHAQPP